MRAIFYRGAVMEIKIKESQIPKSLYTESKEEHEKRACKTAYYKTEAKKNKEVIRKMIEKINKCGGLDRR